MKGYVNTNEHESGIVAGSILDTPSMKDQKSTKFMVSVVDTSTYAGAITAYDIESGNVAETSITHLKKQLTPNAQVIMPIEAAYTEEGYRKNCHILKATRMSKLKFAHPEDTLKSINEKKRKLKMEKYIDVLRKNHEFENRNRQNTFENLLKNFTKNSSDIIVSASANNQKEKLSSSSSITPPIITVLEKEKLQQQMSSTPSTNKNIEGLKNQTPVDGDAKPNAADQKKTETDKTQTGAGATDKKAEPEAKAEEKQLDPLDKEIKEAQEKLEKLKKDKETKNLKPEDDFSTEKLEKLEKSELIELAQSGYQAYNRLRPLEQEKVKKVREEANEYKKLLVEVARKQQGEEAAVKLDQLLTEEIKSKSLNELEKDNQAKVLIAASNKKMLEFMENGKRAPHEVSSNNNSKTNATSKDADTRTNFQRAKDSFYQTDYQFSEYNERFSNNSSNNSKPSFKRNQEESSKTDKSSETTTQSGEKKQRTVGDILPEHVMERIKSNRVGRGKAVLPNEAF